MRLSICSLACDITSTTTHYSLQHFYVTYYRQPPNSRCSFSHTAMNYEISAVVMASHVNTSRADLNGLVVLLV